MRGEDPHGGELHVAFVFTGSMAYPPVFHDMKVYYVSKEMLKRGISVHWVQLGGPGERRWVKDGIDFAVLRAPKGKLLPEMLRLLRLFAYCAVRRIRVVYLDEWFFFRKRPFARLMGQMILRVMGSKLVLDQRDPYIDYEVAAGVLKEGTARYRLLSWMCALFNRQTDLIVLPSEAYADLYQSEGVPHGKVFGIFRGIDPNLFGTGIGQNSIRSSLGLSDSFVIGWFGLMHPFRMIREIIIPLIENIHGEIPNAHFLIGGEGPLLSDFEKIQQGPARDSLTLLGTVPYDKLPGYLAACDLTICPVSPDFNLCKYSNWLKIAESVAVGTPVVAARTQISELDFRDMRGVLWVEPDYRSFLSALREFQKNPEQYKTAAREQAKHFKSYSIESTIPKIVDRVLALIRPQPSLGPGN